MKKALVLISFGTTHTDAKEYAIDPLREDLKKAYPDYDFYLAYTSGMIRRALEKRGIFIEEINHLLQKLVRNYDEILLVPTHLLEGIEYKKIVDAAREYKDRFQKLTLVKPVLSNTDDLGRMVEFLEDEFGSFLNHPDFFLLLMGHGSESEAAKMYQHLNQRLLESGHENAFVSCVEGEPGFDEGIERADQTLRKRIVIVPLMFVAGEHVKNDLLGEGGWVKTLWDRTDHSPYPLWLGLGEYPAFRKIILEKIEEAIKDE